MSGPIALKFILAYDGTHYLGWQDTQVGPSIEGVFQLALEKIFQEKLRLQAASRTDAGVHALGQVVQCVFPQVKVPLHRLQHSLNCMLPQDIRVQSIEEVPLTFHPTLDSTAKEYLYRLEIGRWQLPWNRFYYWHVKEFGRLEEVREAAKSLIGTHDFRSFCNQKKNETYEDFTRTLTALDVVMEKEDFVTFRVVGNHFLYKMVRNLVGALTYVAVGKLEAAEIPLLLAKRSRMHLGVTAPAHGLFLSKIFYQ